MKDFITAALPWVLAGLAVALLCAGLDRKLKNGEAGEKKKAEQRIALGLSLGLLFGVMLNGAGLFDNLALCLSLGPLWGMAIAAQ